MIPTYEQLMLPLLRRLASGEQHVRALSEAFANDFRLTEEERAAQLPSGRGVTLVHSRVGWAKTYLKQAGLVAQPRRGWVALTALGADVLRAPPERLDAAYLARFPDFAAFLERSRRVAEDEPATSTPGTVAVASPAPAATPEETIEAALAAIEARLRDELLERLLAAPPAFFEKTVMRLMQAMGYGVEAEHLGGAGDGGVDAVIFEDRLGLDLIYIQAKRYAADRAISAEALRGFSGALDDKGARKGVFLTTSRFTADAEAFARRQQHKRLVLVDGAALCALMLRHGVGVREDRTVTIKRLDAAYFEPEED